MAQRQVAPNGVYCAYRYYGSPSSRYDLPPIDGDELLAAMGKVALPEEEYEALLVDAIVNGATPDN